MTAQIEVGNISAIKANNLMVGPDNLFVALALRLYSVNSSGIGAINQGNRGKVKLRNRSMGNLHNIVGRQVSKRRMELNLTQDELASRCQVAGWDISRGTLAKIESAVRKVNDSEVWWLAKVLKVDIPTLYPKRVKSPRAMG